MSFDQIADMLTRIRNAQRAGNLDVTMAASNFKLAIARLLYRKGYIDEVAIFSEGNRRYLRLRLKYLKNKPVINGIRQVSRQGQRIYVGSDGVSAVKNGYGIAIISTSKGVLTDGEAKEKGLGGEFICEVW